MAHYYNLDELKAKIVAGLDLYQFLDVLEISFSELVDKFEDELEENYEEFVDALGEEPYV